MKGSPIIDLRLYKATSPPPASKAVLRNKQ